MKEDNNEILRKYGALKQECSDLEKDAAKNNEENAALKQQLQNSINRYNSLHLEYEKVCEYAEDQKSSADYLKRNIFFYPFYAVFQVIFLIALIQLPCTISYK